MKVYSSRDIVVQQINTDVKYCMIWLHDFGEETYSYKEIFSAQNEIFPSYCKSVFPCAPARPMPALAHRNYYSWF